MTHTALTCARRRIKYKLYLASNLFGKGSLSTWKTTKNEATKGIIIKHELIEFELRDIKNNDVVGGICCFLSYTGYLTTIRKSNISKNFNIQVSQFFRIDIISNDF